MLKTELEEQRRQAVRLLAHLGLRRTSRAVLYLGVILPGAMENFPPGPALWAPAAERFGQRTANIRCAVHAQIRRAYQRDPVRFSELVPEGDVLFAAPRSRDFVALAAKWLRRYQFLDQYDGGRFTGARIVERPAQARVQGP